MSFTNNCHVHILISDYITFWKLKDTCKEVIPIYIDTKTQNINRLRSNTNLSMFVLIQNGVYCFYMHSRYLFSLDIQEVSFRELTCTFLTVWTFVSGSQRTTSKLKVRTKKTRTPGGTNDRSHVSNSKTFEIVEMSTIILLTPSEDLIDKHFCSFVRNLRKYQRILFYSG